MSNHHPTRVPKINFRRREHLLADPTTANLEPGERTTEGPERPVSPLGVKAGTGLDLLSTAQRQKLFLEGYANSRNVRASCLRAGISRDVFYRWKRLPAFLKRLQDADADYLDMIRAQLDTRSKDSDAVLIFRAKALLAEFKETLRQEHVVTDGSGLPIKFTLVIGETTPEAPGPEVPPVTGPNGHPPAADAV